MNTSQDIINQLIADIQSTILQLSDIQSVQDFIDKRPLFEKLIRLQDFATQLNEYALLISTPLVQQTREEVSTIIHKEPENKLNNEIEITENENIVDETKTSEEQVQISENTNEPINNAHLSSDENAEISTTESISIENGANEVAHDIQPNELLGDFDNGEESLCVGGVEPSISDKIEEIEEAEKENTITEASLEEENLEENKPETKEHNTPTETSQEKKLKLANIKGLQTPIFEEGAKAVQGEFFADMFPKTPKVFKLDLNDKLAFTQKLFDGSQHELNETVRILNSFDHVDAAKEYLSDMYYEKNWEKVDEYAQRLWSLVENRFL
ncbi:hypothetical protein [Bergeyella zoohelcum]|uniref:Uncharacterized protein n=1 Tax=Bergeyella zoohelcum ATCC 43767 TaxID=883096 RepID=K1MAL4_9FLAO|nr:hypothetical protein [Bergeyella zoohelcum]EKB59428.1 hypothetical protein HMPREF9699_00364 [Bergeyella zoohelcum ATCC 43767]SUV49460.1 Uncharacterised protein [Bergeyella zoohelcum]